MSDVLKYSSISQVPNSHNSIRANKNDLNHSLQCFTFSWNAVIIHIQYSYNITWCHLLVKWTYHWKLCFLHLRAYFLESTEATNFFFSFLPFKKQNHNIILSLCLKLHKSENTVWNMNMKILSKLLDPDHRTLFFPVAISSLLYIMLYLLSLGIQ